MRKFKNSSILLIVLLIFAISVAGCSSKKPKVEELLVLLEEEKNEPQIQKEEEHSEDLVEEDEIDNEELSPEEEIDIAKTDNEEPVVEAEEINTDEGPDKTEPFEEAEKEEVVEKKNAIKIKGKVGVESTFALDDLKKMTEIIFEDDFYSLNNFGTTSYTHFRGVNLWKLLEEKTKISPDATYIKIIATDGYEVEFTVDQVKRQDYIDETNPDKAFPMIIAWEEKGQEYDSSEGPPYKLIVGQAEAGDVNKPQWVSKIDRIIVE